MARYMPILYVVHDTHDEWQFLTGEDVDMQDMMLVAWSEIVEIDSSIATLDLGMGYEAVRKTISANWSIRKID